MFVVFILLGLWGGVAAYNLALGLRSGDMQCFYSYRAGQASRAEHPVRFWTYAGVNLFIALLCGMTLWIMWLGIRERS